MNIPESITGRTELLAIIADPVAQAASPALINAELLSRGQFGEFALLPLRVPRAALASVLHGLRAVANFRGAVISMPHKQAVLSLLDQPSAAALREGACNVIYRSQDGRLYGDILDGAGFVHGLRLAGHDVAGRRVLLVGAGGAARSIAFALAGAGAATIGVRNRTLAHARQLADAVSAAVPACVLEVVSQDQVLQSHWDIVVNASPLGMQPHDELPVPEQVLRAGMLVADIVISARPTPLLLAAAQRECLLSTGRQMLEAQKSLLMRFMLEGPDKAGYVSTAGE